MKLYKCLFAAVIGTVTSCTNDTESFSTSSHENLIETVLSTSKTYTRFNDVSNQWEAGDKIGVYMMPTETVNPYSKAVNIPFLAQSTGTTTQFKTETPIPVENEGVDFVAYYPYNTEITNNDNGAIYKYNLSDQSQGYAPFDLLTAQVSNIKPNGIPSLAFNFAHQFCKVIVKPKVKEGSTIESVLFRGLSSSGEFNLNTNEITEQESIDIIPFTNLEDGSYTAIIPPTEVASSLSVIFKIKDSNSESKEFTYTVNSEKIASFEKGKSYTINLDVQTITVPDPEDPVGDYDHIVKVTADTDLTTCLEGLSGTCAIQFNASQATSFNQQLVIPNEITELSFICTDETQAEVSMKDIMIHPALTLLAFDNIKLSGDRELPLIETSKEMANQGIIKFTNCHISQMKAIHFWNDTNVTQENVLNDFIIDNCIVTDMDVVLHYRASATVTFTKSTFYNIKSRIYNFQFKNTQLSSTRLVLRIEDCTYEFFGSHCIAGADSPADLYFHRNIAIATPGKSLVFRANIFSASDNYVPEGYSNLIHGREYPEAINQIPLATLLPKWSEETPDFTTTYQAGDPRWRISE